jgi:hypothetical protein
MLCYVTRPCEHYHSQVQVPQNLKPYLTVSSETGFPFCHLLWLTGLQWKYSNPPPHGIIYIYIYIYIHTHTHTVTSKHIIKQLEVSIWHWYMSVIEPLQFSNVAWYKSHCLYIVLTLFTNTTLWGPYWVLETNWCTIHGFPWTVDSCSPGQGIICEGSLSFQQKCIIGPYFESNTVSTEDISLKPILMLLTWPVLYIL